MQASLLQRIIENGIKGLKRFPFTFLFAFAAFCVVTFLFVTQGDLDLDSHPVILPLLSTFVLGIPLSFALRMFGEGLKDNLALRVGLQLVGMGLLALFYFLTPFENDTLTLFFILIFSLLLHLLTAFAPFIRKENREGFWTYNFQLFTRFGLATAYSVLIYGGLAIALSIMSFLLKIRFGPETFGTLFAFVAFVIHPLIFLSGIPEDFRPLDSLEEYPRGLRIVTQFVLLPLVLLYLAILYVYGISILANWELPEGGVAMLVLVFSVGGMVTILLLHPYRESAEGGWVSKISRIYFFLILPLLVLLYIAIFTRVFEYGITVPRYYVLLLALWLTGISFYFIIAKKPGLRVVPISLFIVAVLSLFGPWGAFFVSRKSQLSKLETQLSGLEMLKDGKAVLGKGFWDGPAEYSVYDKLEYLEEWHSLAPVQDWFDEPVANASQVIDLLSEPDTEYQMLESRPRFSFSWYGESRLKAFKPVEGFDYHAHLRMTSLDWSRQKNTEAFNEGGFSFWYNPQNQFAYLSTPESDTLNWDLNQWVEGLLKGKDGERIDGTLIPEAKASISAKGGNYAAELRPYEIRGNCLQADSTGLRLDILFGDLLWKYNPED